jgi:hypothetical protein
VVRNENGRTVRLDESRSGKRLGLSIEYGPPKGLAWVGLERSELPVVEGFIATPAGEPLFLDGPPDEGGRLELAWNPQRNRLRVVIEPVTPWTGDLPSIDLRPAEIRDLLRALRALQSP